MVDPLTLFLVLFSVFFINGILMISGALLMVKFNIIKIKDKPDWLKTKKEKNLTRKNK